MLKCMTHNWGSIKTVDDDYYYSIKAIGMIVIIALLSLHFPYPFSIIFP